MNFNIKSASYLAMLAVLIFSLCFFSAPQPADAYIDTVIDGEIRWDPYRGPDMMYFVQVVTVISTVTTDVIISTACEDIDAYMCTYDDMTLQATATAQFHVPLGAVETVTPAGMDAGTVTLVRTDPSSSTPENVTIVLIDYDAF